MCTRKRTLVVVTGLLFLFAAAPAALAQQADYVFHISVDGLRPDAITNLGALAVPNFYRMRTEGAFTDNARADYFYTETLQNHVTQLTARGVKDPYGNIGSTYSGHDWTGNSTPPVGDTLATNKGAYVAGAFDVADAAGLNTGLYATKTKFSLFTQSWPTYIDHYRIANYDSPTVMTQMKNDIAAQAQGYTFLHLYNPDREGHDHGWMGSEYLNSIKTVDGYLGEIFALIATNPAYTDNTAIVLTADHGGTGTGHGTATVLENYRVPFYVWGPGVTAGADLYDLNLTTRLDPGTARPTYYAAGQPIHNGEASNLALDLLGLSAIPGSTLNSLQNLAVHEPVPGDANLDGNVDAMDYVVVSNHYGVGSTWTEGDVNSDGAVDALDYVVISNNYGSHAPEPATMALLALGGLMVALRQRRAA